MVYQNRKTVKTTVPKDVSPMRNMNGSKHVLSSSPADSYLGSKLNLPSGSSSSSTSSSSSNANGGSNSVWHYNNMITNNRDKFNSLHFC